MLRITKALFFLFFLVGLQRPSSADDVPLSASTAIAGKIGKEICRQPEVQDAFNSDVGQLLDVYFTGLKSTDMYQYASVKDLVRGQRSLDSKHFEVVSIDIDAGHAECSAQITVINKTRHHGTIVVANQLVNFKIEPKADDETVIVEFPELMGFVRALSKKMVAITTNADVGFP